MKWVYSGFVAAACVSGCASSPPMHYYTLSEVAAASRVTVPADTAPVRLDRVTIPGELDRLQLVRRIDATRLQISDQDRWAAPLEEMIRRVLSGDLAARLPVNLVADPNEPSIGERRQSIAVDIQEFYADAGCSVALRATWTIRSTDNKQSRQGSAAAQVPSAGGCSGAAALPAAMSQALAQFSDKLAAAISTAQ